MKIYRIDYPSGNYAIVKGKNTLDIVKRFDLCTAENIKTKIPELEDNPEVTK